MINLNAVVLRTLVRGRLVASGVILMMILAGGAALAAPVAQEATAATCAGVSAAATVAPVAQPAPCTDASAAPTSVAASETEKSTPKTNPFKDDKEKAAAGHKLYIAYGCVGCHGQSGGGGMGPSLIDNNWRYGGADADLFHSIHDGRPKGMPAWSSHLSDEQIWEVITFVRSISIAE